MYTSYFENKRRIHPENELNIKWSINYDLKTCLSILNRFLNSAKVSSVPLLLNNGEIISNYSEKAKLFNKLFVSQWCPIASSKVCLLN